MSIALNGQSNCNLPGPTNLHVISTTTTSLEIGWSEVIGAMDYEIETVEVISGITVSLLNSASSPVMITGLEEGKAYDITITTICSNGDYGGSSNIRAHTGIVIVDVIFQITCDPGPNTPPGNSYPANLSNPSSFPQFPIEINQVLSLDGTLNNDPSVGPFKLLFETNFPQNAPPELIANSTSDFDDKLRFFAANANGNGLPAMVKYKDPAMPDAPQNWHELAYIYIQFSYNSKVIIEWKEPVTVQYTYCGTNDDPGNGNQDEENTSDLEVSPNPTSGWFTMIAPEDTPVTITDMYGQVWYENELYTGEPHEAEASDWPNGTYIIHTIEEQEPVQVLLVKTE